VASTIELLLLAQMTQWQGAWTSYTPTWTSSGTAPVIGNGSMVGYYNKVGRLVTAKIAMEGGTTTTFGTGTYSFSLPVTAAVTGIAAANFAHTGTWVMNDSGVSYYVVGAIIIQSAPTVVQGVVNGTANFLGATAPATWTASSSFACTITYESTS
jgi:hypothetical protein